MRATWRRIFVAVVAGCFGAVLCAGCASEPAAQEPAKAGVTSLLDLKWVNPAAAPAVAGGPAVEELGSGRLAHAGSPGEYGGAQQGRVSSEAIPKLAPLPELGIARPDLKELPPLDQDTPLRPKLAPVPETPDISSPPGVEKSAD